jgi:hypothetical protein
MRTIAFVTFGAILLGGSLSNRGIVRGQANPVQTHIGHVMESFQAAPNQQGLLPTALAEAKIAMTHAGLALKNPDNLDAIKLHAGHVINALDPSIEATGPGQGFGVKKAAAGVAQHIQLASKSPGASFVVMAYATHVAAAANNAAKRADEVIALAQKARAATTAAEGVASMQQANTALAAMTNGVDYEQERRDQLGCPRRGSSASARASTGTAQSRHVACLAASR